MDRRARGSLKYGQKGEREPWRRTPPAKKKQVWWEQDLADENSERQKEEAAFKANCRPRGLLTRQ
jgi:hypothetical protein